VTKTDDHFKSGWLFPAVMAAGFAARLLVATLGQDYDMDSWQIMAKLADHGDNVYASTDRYNFAPGWFQILHALNLLSGHNPTVFRYAVTGFLSLGDAGIFFILWRRFGKLAACWFFLNPVSVIISGYQCNFDNLAILLGLLAVLQMGDEFDQPITRRKLLALFILGLSLVIKHVFFAFPFWLAVKQRGMLQKLVVIFVPVFIFALSFVPYWHTGSQGIIQNVFLYRSMPLNYFYLMFVPASVQNVFDSLMVWLLLLALFAFIYRQKSAVESMLFYTGLLVAGSPAMVNEYLAIPAVFVATHLNLFTILYTAIATLRLLVDANGLHLAGASPTTSFDFSCYALFMLGLGLVWVTWRKSIMSFIERCAFEVTNQLGLKK
jgi:hypothetical protein